MNKYVANGRLTKEVELRRTTDGTPYAFIILAINGYGKKVNFVNCAVWGKTAEAANTYLIKGSHILINGELNITSKQEGGQWKNSYQITVATFEFLDKKTDTIATQPSGDTPLQMPENESSQVFGADTEVINVEDIDINEIVF